MWCGVRGLVGATCAEMLLEPLARVFSLRVCWTANSSRGPSRTGLPLPAKVLVMSIVMLACYWLLLLYIMHV